MVYSIISYRKIRVNKISRLKKNVIPEIIFENISRELLIDNLDTESFNVIRYNLKNTRLKIERGPAVYVVTAGRGLIKYSSGERNLEKGTYFFHPFSADGVEISTNTFIEIVKCYIS